MEERESLSLDLHDKLSQQSSVESDKLFESGESGDICDLLLDFEQRGGDKQQKEGNINVIVNVLLLETYLLKSIKVHSLIKDLAESVKIMIVFVSFCAKLMATNLYIFSLFFFFHLCRTCNQPSSTAIKSEPTITIKTDSFHGNDSNV